MKYCLKHVVVMLLFVFSSMSVLATDFDATRQKIEAAMDANSRPDEDVARDKNRMPIETLEFFGFRHDMRVLELIPGAGWYTRILAPVLRDEGELFAAFGTGRIEKNVLGKKGYDQVTVLAKEAKLFRPQGARYYKIENANIDISDVDMVLTFRNYHNFDTAGRVAMNQAVYKALKPGGIYGVVDHTRRHMEGETFENRRRFDPVKAIKEIQAAGFELVDFTDLHYRADDELRYEVGRKTVSGNTDRWTLKFKKVSK